MAPPDALHPETEDSTEHIHMPAPSIYPMILASGIAFFGLGLLTNVGFIVFGLLVSAGALTGWVKELRHEAG